MTVYLIRGGEQRKAQAEFVRAERVPTKATSGGSRMVDTVVVRLKSGKLIRCIATGRSASEWRKCPYAPDRRYGADGRDLGPVEEQPTA